MNMVLSGVVLACASRAAGLARGQSVGAKFASREPARGDATMDQVKGAASTEKARPFSNGKAETIASITDGVSTFGDRVDEYSYDFDDSGAADTTPAQFVADLIDDTSEVPMDAPIPGLSGPAQISFVCANKKGQIIITLDIPQSGVPDRKTILALLTQSSPTKHHNCRSSSQWTFDVFFVFKRSSPLRYRPALRKPKPSRASAPALPSNAARP